MANGLDFSQVTAAFGSALGNAPPTNWQIAQSSFKNVPFHIFSSAQASSTQAANYGAGVPRVHDKTGRRKILYQFPFQDGQTTGDLGRAPFSFEFDVIFFGPNYFTGYMALYNALNQASPGILRHPVLGDINCVATNWEVVHENVAAESLAMKVTFEEHTFDPTLVFTQTPGNTLPTSASTPSTFKAAVIAAFGALQTISNTVNTIQAYKSAATSLINGTVNLVNSYKQQFLGVLSGIYLSFAPDSVSTSPDVPGVLPVSLGGTLSPSGSVTSNQYPLAGSSQTPFSTSSTPSTTNPQPLTPIQAQNEVNSVLQTLEQIVQQINSLNNGQGALDLYAEVVTLKQTGLQLKIACVQGIASSNNLTTQYTVPSTIPFMSIREVAFAIGLDVNLSDQITTLNPQLLSVNNIPGGTVLQIPVIPQVAA